MDAITSTPAAFIRVNEHGLAEVCAWHNDVVPGSKEAADAYAETLGLRATHGICPLCQARELAHIRALTPHAA